MVNLHVHDFFQFKFHARFQLPGGTRTTVSSFGAMARSSGKAMQTSSSSPGYTNLIYYQNSSFKQRKVTVLNGVMWCDIERCHVVFGTVNHFHSFSPGRVRQLGRKFCRSKHYYYLWSIPRMRCVCSLGRLLLR